jgi:hypothetical protein
MTGLKFGAPAGGVYSAEGATFLGASEATAATIGAASSGAAVAVGGAVAAYVVGSSAVAFYQYLTDSKNSCAGVP